MYPVSPAPLLEMLPAELPPPVNFDQYSYLQGTFILLLLCSGKLCGIHCLGGRQEEIPRGLLVLNTAEERENKFRWTVICNELQVPVSPVTQRDYWDQ